jgi:ubiquinone/menaquinone biosynthesis C-methylase UbiE
MAATELRKANNRELTPPYARFLVRLIRPFPNFDFFFVKSLRRKAARLLQLKPGDRALDVGCGPGGSFSYLLDAVGPEGEVVGVEISPETAINARKRIAKNTWNNARVLVSAAEKATLDGEFDGLLMFAAPDVYASPQALANLFPHLKSNARVVVFGGKLSRHRFGKIPNLLFQLMFSRLTFPSTPRMDYEPWALLQSRVHEFHVEEYFFGLMFLAWGSVKIARATTRMKNTGKIESDPSGLL